MRILIATALIICFGHCAITSAQPVNSHTMTQRHDSENTEHRHPSADPSHTHCIFVTGGFAHLPKGASATEFAPVGSSSTKIEHPTNERIPDKPTLDSIFRPPIA